MEPIIRYRGLDAFYKADPRRRQSGRIDFGVLWHDGIGSTRYWRLTWIEMTGEIYALELTGDGLVAVLAEHLRRPAVEWTLQGWEHEHSLLWAWQAVTFPWVAAGFSGYVSQPEKRTVWVVRDGWWERPLKATSSARRTDSSVTGWGDTVSGPYVLADSLLADFFGHTDDEVLTEGTTSYAIGWPDLEDFAISSGDIAHWLGSAGVGGRAEPGVMQEVATGSGRLVASSALEPMSHRVVNPARCSHRSDR